MMNWVVSSTVLIVCVIMLRFLLKGRISLRLQYALWAIVMLRLLIPFSLGGTAISIGNALEELSQKEEVQAVYELTETKLPNKSYEQAYQEVAKRYENVGLDIETIPEEEFAETIEYEVLETMKGELSISSIAKTVWIVGSVLVGGWFCFINFCFGRKVFSSRKKVEHIIQEKLCVYLCDEVETPCLFGGIRPSIYVTSEVIGDEERLAHVLAHETTHYFHGDHIWGCLRALCVAIHWYNPFVWCAAILSRNDAELACDEATIARLGEGERVSYGKTLIGLTCEQPSRIMLTATTMTGSKKSIRERISMIAKKPKMKLYTFVVTIFITMVCVGCTFTGAKSDALDKLYHEGVVYYEELMEKTYAPEEELRDKIQQFLIGEREFILSLESNHQIDLEQEMPGVSYYYLVTEVDSWADYEEIAKDYYSEKYLKETFTKSFIEENEVFAELDGKLYRVNQDIRVFRYSKDTIEVRQVDKDTYIAMIKAMYGEYGSYVLDAYRVEVAQDKKYGFEITEKIELRTNKKNFEYYADVTHDGVAECIKVDICDDKEQENTTVEIKVYNNAESLLYQDELLLHPNLGASYYLTSYEGKDYLLYYKTDINHDTIMWQFEVFSLSETGEKILQSTDEIEVSFYHVEEVNVEEWKALAEEKNKYFEGSCLLADTCYGILEYSTDIQRITYLEEFTWLILDDVEMVEKNLESILEGYRKLYVE